ncbi:MAG: hypothetical protein CMG13_06140 [Candidatus Marinimicrobia bacterium]|nr:hypothetical protein [Candidatus Neomarinimicrobiota bacterium]|tara:strand:- start:930 stop:1715 length:786 start_codon:yes stop_codon:yes gene_type:complete
MSKHLSLRSGNPALNSKVFKDFSSISEDTMTLNGAVNKTAISLLILLLSGFVGFYMTFKSGNLSMDGQIMGMSSAYMIVGFVVGLILALATIFKKHLSPYTVPAYAIFEGLALGGISAFFSAMYDGIVFQAILITASIFCVLLFLYKTKIIKATENFKLGIVAATGGIAIVYLVNFAMSFFGGGLPVMDINNASVYSIGFSLVVVVIAALNLVLDFDFIEEASDMGVPKYMEWYGAFGLMVTLVWLYLEILRLLAKLNSRR